MIYSGKGLRRRCINSDQACGDCSGTLIPASFFAPLDEKRRTIRKKSIALPKAYNLATAEVA
jgi:hypothetical protein